MPSGLSSNKSSILKIIATCLGGFAILLLLVLLLTPLFFSSTLGNRFLSKKISNQTDLKIEINELSLSWFGSQSAKGFRIQKKDAHLVFTCEDILTDASLFQLIFRNDLGQLTLKKPNLQMTGALQPAAHLKTPSLKNAGFLGISPNVQLSMPIIKLPIHGKILIEEGKISLSSPEVDPIVFDKIAMSLDLQPENEIALNLNCVSHQHQVDGMIAIKGSASQMNSALPNVAVQASMSKLPVRGIDQLTALIVPELNGLIYSAVGSTIDMQCNFAAARGNFDLSMNAQSPQINVDLATQTLDGVVSLKSPAQFNFNLTPEFFQKASKLSPILAGLCLKQPAYIQATLSQFSSPLPIQDSDLQKTSFEATIAAPPQMIFSINGKPLLLNNFHLTAKSASLGQTADFSLTTGLQTQAQAGSVAIAGNFSQLFSQNATHTLTVNATKLPIELFEMTANSPLDLKTWLGSTVDLSGKLQMLEGNSQLHLAWQSEFLKAPSIDLSLKNPLTLNSPAAFTFKLNPQLLATAAIKIIQADPIEGTLQSLVVPTDNIKNSHLEAAINAGQILMNGSVPIKISNIKATLLANTFDQVSVKIDGVPLKAFISGSFRPATHEFVLNKPFTAECVLDNTILKAIAPMAPELANPTLVQFMIDPTSLPIEGLDLNNFNLKGQLSMPEMTMLAQGKAMTLKNTSFPFQWDSKTKTAALQISSQVQNPSGQAGVMQGQLTISNFSSEKGIDLNRAAIQGSLDLQNLSSTLIDVFSGKTALGGILGSTFSGKLKLQSTTDQQNVAIKWVSPNLNIDSAFMIDSSGIQLQGAANQISWILTPESYKILDKIITGPNNAMIPFEVSESSTFTISLTKLSLPATFKKEVSSLTDRFPDLVFDLEKLQLSASGSNPKLAFLDKRSKETIQLSNLSFALSKNANGGPLIASLDSGVVTQTGSASAPQSVRNGSLSIAGKLTQTLNEKGAFDLSHLTCSLQAKANQLPSRALDIIARAKGRTDFPFTTVFGDMINATIKVDLKDFAGPVALNLNTPFTRVNLEGHLVNGALLLNDAIYAQMKITPEVSRMVLKEVNPLNLSYIYSQAPVTLEIPAEGFYFPIYPFSMGKIAIPDATIELGKIACRNEGNVNITLGLLKTRQFDKSGELFLWFAPIDLSIKKGFVDIDRTEILLADTFDVCLWGQVDMVKDYVDMVLGLTAQTLSKAFGIKNLPENYVLTIPMKGPADNVQINTGKATAKVALLLAWQNKDLAGSLGGGTAGALFGEVLGKMATLPDSDAKVPPAKHPFPWEIGKGGRTSHSSHEKKRQFKGNEKPLKQILKVIR